MANIYRCPDELTSPKIAQAMRKGGFGMTIYDDNRYRPGGWAGFGSPQNWESLQATIAAGEDWFYADHAYFGRRQFYRITKNAYMHSGVGKPDLRRLSRHWQAPLPYHRRGSKVIVCPQSQSHLDRHGEPDWLAKTLDKLHRNTDRDIIVHGKRDAKPLRKFLPDAWAVVCHSSMAGLEALMHGVPAFVTAPCALSRHTKRDLAEIEDPLYPEDRLELAGVLAANQWTLEEIAGGKAWRAMQQQG